MRLTAVNQQKALFHRRNRLRNRRESRQNRRVARTREGLTAVNRLSGLSTVTFAALGAVPALQVFFRGGKGRKGFAARLAMGADPSPTADEEGRTEQVPLDAEHVETAHVAGRVQPLQMKVKSVLVHEPRRPLSA